MAFVALLVFVGSYLGALVGTIAVFPEVRTAILFPPYAVLASALMLSPVRQWWVYVVASMAGNFWPHLSHEGLTSFVLLAEAANVVRGLVAAIGVRALGERVGSFDTIRGTIVFLGAAVIAAPGVAAFIGAATVALHKPDVAYWEVWQAWLLSNMLTGLTLLPLILIVCVGGREWLRGGSRISRARRVEAGVLALGMLLLGTFMFAVSQGGLAPASLYAPLPLLLWAAVRFGPGGTVAVLVALTCLTIAGAMSGNGPFVTHSPVENLIQLQYSLIAWCVPLLLLATIVRQQARTNEALRRGEDALRASLGRVHDLAGCLITAQEAERTRIAGELHDDFSQRLAAISLGLSAVRRKLHGESEEHIDGLQREMVELTNEMRDLSHDLHPGILRHAGLGPALAARAAEFRRHHEIEVVVDAPEHVAIPAPLALCLYRVAQEALENVARHAQARRAEIVVSCDGRQVMMTVRDDGRGFDTRAARPRSGLGLISLEERVRLVGGRLTIESQPRRGTQMRVEVPVGDISHAHAASQGAAGG